MTVRIIRIIFKEDLSKKRIYSSGSYAVISKQADIAYITFKKIFEILFIRNNIRMDLREIGWGGMDWIDLALDRDQWRALVNTVMNLRVQ
jgi:hypothetical protein